MSAGGKNWAEFTIGYTFDPALNRECSRRSEVLGRQLEIPNRIQIAIDGPVGAGKTTVGRRLARTLGIRFLDTGLTYRAVTHECLARRIDPADAAEVGSVAAGLELSVEMSETGDTVVKVDGKDVTDQLRSPDIDRTVSAVSAIPSVRQHMVRAQRAIASSSAIVMVGRDIGTVVLPDAQLKIFLTASDATRARRRHAELAAQGSEITYAAVLEALRRRDRIDSERETSPLKPARDARIVDTDNMSLEEVVESIVSLVPAA